METIAVSEKASFWKIADIKAKLLAFDKIYIPQGKEDIDRQTLELDLHNKNFSLQDVEYLETQGVVCKNPINDSQIVNKALEKISEYNQQNNGINGNTRYIFGNILERLSIQELSKDSKDIFIPSSTLTTLPTLGDKNKIQELYSLVIEQMPILSEEVPLDEVISFKKEHSSEYKKLILWTTKNSEYESMELRKEELSDMIENFRKYKEIGDLKFRPGKVELLFQGLGMFTDVFTLRFGSVSKTIVSLRKTKAELMEHELNNPNRPLSYIVKAQDEFQS